MPCWYYSSCSQPCYIGGQLANWSWKLMCMQNCFFQANKNLPFQKGRATRNNSLTHCCGWMAGGYQVIIRFPFCNNHGLNFGNWCLSVSSELDREFKGWSWQEFRDLQWVLSSFLVPSHTASLTHCTSTICSNSITTTSTDQPSVVIQSQNPPYLAQEL